MKKLLLIASYALTVITPKKKFSPKRTFCKLPANQAAIAS